MIRLVAIAAASGAVYGACSTRITDGHYGGAGWALLSVGAWMLLYRWKPMPTWGEAVACGLVAPILSSIPTLWYGLIYIGATWYVTWPVSIATGVAVKLLADEYPIKSTEDTLCPNCGYDLHANESGVCPECGEAIPRAKRRYLKNVRFEKSDRTGAGRPD